MAEDVEYLVVARIVSPHGIKGEVKAELVTDFPDRFAYTEYLYLGPTTTATGWRNPASRRSRPPQAGGGGFQR